MQQTHPGLSASSTPCASPTP